MNISLALEVCLYKCGLCGLVGKFSLEEDEDFGENNSAVSGTVGVSSGYTQLSEICEH